MAEERILAKGFYISRRDGVQPFVVGKLSINLEDAIPFLEEHANEAGYVNIDMLWNRAGDRITGFLDTWQPEPKKEGYDLKAKKPKSSGPIAEDDNDIPF